MFGHNTLPMGGIFGAVDGLGGAVEHQRAGSPHFHGFATLVYPFQHCSLHELARLIQDSSVDIDALKEYRVHVCQEEHFNQVQHEAGLDRLEAGWQTNYSGFDHFSLSFVKADLLQAAVPHLWASGCYGEGTVSGETAEDQFPGRILADAEEYSRMYRAEAQFVFHVCSITGTHGRRLATGYQQLTAISKGVKAR